MCTVPVYIQLKLYRFLSFLFSEMGFFFISFSEIGFFFIYILFHQQPADALVWLVKSCFKMF